MVGGKVDAIEGGGRLPFEGCECECECECAIRSRSVGDRGQKQQHHHHRRPLSFFSATTTALFSPSFRVSSSFLGGCLDVSVVSDPLDRFVLRIMMPEYSHDPLSAPVVGRLSERSSPFSHAFDSMPQHGRGMLLRLDAITGRLLFSHTNLLISMIGLPRRVRLQAGVRFELPTQIPRALSTRIRRKVHRLTHLLCQP